MLGGQRGGSGGAGSISVAPASPPLPNGWVVAMRARLSTVSGPTVLLFTWNWYMWVPGAAVKTQSRVVVTPMLGPVVR